MTDEQRGIIIGLHKSRKSAQSIVKILQDDHIKISKSGVQYIITNYKKRGTTSRKNGSGRPTKSSPRDNHAMKFIALADRKVTLKSMSSTFRTSTGLQISRQTISRRLRDQGIRSYRCKKVPMISKINMKKRLQWVNANQLLNWDNIMWSDECRFSLVSDRPSRCLRRPGEGYLPQCTQKTVNKSEGIMVWGCFSKNGVGELHRVTKGVKINSEEYVSILSNALLPSLDLIQNGRFATFMQDNAPCHKTKKVFNWLKERNIRVIEDWPAQSPDLNPIENLWDHVNRMLQHHNITNVEQLWLTVKEIWTNIDSGTIQKLVDSMPNRILDVQKSRGGNTKY